MLVVDGKPKGEQSSAEHAPGTPLVCACGDTESASPVMLLADGTYEAMCDECYACDESSLCDICEELTWGLWQVNKKGRRLACWFCVAQRCAGSDAAREKYLLMLSDAGVTPDATLLNIMDAAVERKRLVKAGAEADEVSSALFLRHGIRRWPLPD